MDELAKVRRVLGKAQPGAPHAVLLVLDANTGQNALAQVVAFDRAVGLTGLVLTKLDGSAKGGVVAAIAREHPVPLAFVGVGEGVDDLRPFVGRRVRRRAHSGRRLTGLGAIGGNPIPDARPRRSGVLPGRRASRRSRPPADPPGPLPVISDWISRELSGTLALSSPEC